MSEKIPERQEAVQLVGPDQLVLNERKEVFRPNAHQMLCRVEVVGLCFSDLKLLKQFSAHVRKGPVVGGVDPAALAEIPSYVPGDLPTVPGHEPVVRVVAAGEAVTRFKPGERYFIQADWRWLPTASSNGALGYNFEGALQEYVLLDERVLISPEGESMLMPAPEGARSASAFGLVEPWACVEQSYQVRERTALRPGGKLLIVADDGPDPAALRAYAHGPAEVVWAGPQPAPAGMNVTQTLADGLAEAPEGGFDDVLYFGHDAATAERLFAKGANRALFNFVTGGERFGRKVITPLGAVHYKGQRITGTTGRDPAAGLRRIPATGEIRPEDVIHVVGAGGPMGVMHVIRNICQGLPGLTIWAADLSDERLAALNRIAEPKAREHRVAYKPYNSKTGRPDQPIDYAVIMAPVPALVAAAVESCADEGIINIFAGIPADKQGELDLDAYLAKGLYFIGTSGSTMDDMRIVLRYVESGQVDTNVSVAAVAGLAGAVAGIRAVENQEIPGKIMVYPACRGLGLTRLEELPDCMPDVAEKLRDGCWTLEAEQALLARYAG